MSEHTHFVCHLARLNDQRRYKHAADKLQKTENVMEKYKKKLQEGADLRQHVRVSEQLCVRYRYV